MPKDIFHDLLKQQIRFINQLLKDPPPPAKNTDKKRKSKHYLKN